MKIIWSPQAIEQFRELHDFIAEDSVEAAAEMCSKILRLVELLAVHPHAGRPGRIAGTRELVVPETPYIVPYKVRQGGVELIAVFHGARRWPSRF
jgi:toxin ParE1/3/4